MAYKIFLFVEFLFFFHIAPAAEAIPLAENPAVEARMIEITQDLRCLVCQNESLAASQADLAKDLRREVREQVVAGKSDGEIRDYLVARYGDFVLYRPPLKAATWLLWLGPFVLLIIGFLALFRLVRRRAVLAPEEALSAAQAQRVEQLLKG